MWRVLCVEDDPKIAAQIVEYFTKWDRDNPIGRFEAVPESDYEKAKQRLKVERFDLITLDLHDKSDPKPEEEGGKDAAQAGRRGRGARRRSLP